MAETHISKHMSSNYTEDYAPAAPMRLPEPLHIAPLSPTHLILSFLSKICAAPKNTQYTISSHVANMYAQHSRDEIAYNIYMRFYVCKNLVQR